MNLLDKKYMSPHVCWNGDGIPKTLECFPKFPINVLEIEVTGRTSLTVCNVEVYDKKFASKPM